VGWFPILALADDLTGALEVGARFRAPVTLRLEIDPGLPALVIDTETRRQPAAAAAGRVGAVARAARQWGARLVYKKTDSTLRGNIGPELGALVAAYAGARLVYAPAYPAMGRTVRGGRLYVGGVPLRETEFARDPLDPAREEHVPALVAEVPGIVVCDGSSDEDVREVARSLLDAPPPVLAAGPAALAGFLAELAGLGGAPRWPALNNVLLVNGSRSEVSARQAASAPPDWEVFDASLEETGPDRAARVGELVRERIERNRIETLVVFGGDTACGVVKALGSPLLHPLGEALPGVPVSRLQYAGRDLHLVTKAGGFGPPDLLPRLRDLAAGVQ
jgi:uncharacterized protein YgbK (DUF1537 family)